METLRKNKKTRTLMQKKVDQTEKVSKRLAEKQKDIANLKVIMASKEGMVNIQIETVNQEASIEIIDEVIVDTKKCKKCKFTAPNMKILGLHMENDHLYKFSCMDCEAKFPFKNQLKIHKREVHLHVLSATINTKHTKKTANRKQ